MCGYRSDVAISLKTKDALRLVKRLIENEQEDFVDCGNIVVYEDDMTVMSWTEIKWYKEFEEVQIVEEFLSYEEIPYYFIRLGEDNDDVETEYSNPFNEDIDFHIETVKYISIDNSDIENLSAKEFLKGGNENEN